MRTYMHNLPNSPATTLPGRAARVAERRLHLQEGVRSQDLQRLLQTSQHPQHNRNLDHEQRKQTRSTRYSRNLRTEHQTPSPAKPVRTSENMPLHRRTGDLLLARRLPLAIGHHLRLALRLQPKRALCTRPRASSETRFSAQVYPHSRLQ